MKKNNFLWYIIIALFCFALGLGEGQKIEKMKQSDCKVKSQTFKQYKQCIKEFLND